MADGPKPITATSLPADEPRSHPAKFSDSLMPVIEQMLKAAGLADDAILLDPFAGTGKCHSLPWRVRAFELEPEWASQHPSTQVADVLSLPEFPPVDGVVTSPAYGNRLSDMTLDTSKWHRMTYRVALGRDFTENNSAGMPWGAKYREFHEQAWAAVTDRVKPGGWFVLNSKDHVRYGGVRPVSAWHLSTLCALGWTWMGAEAIECPGYRRGTNRGSRLDHEWLILLRLDGTGSRPGWRP